MYIIKPAKTPVGQKGKRFMVTQEAGNNEKTNSTELLNSKASCWGNILSRLGDHSPYPDEVFVKDATISRNKGQWITIAYLRKKAGGK